MSASRFLRNVNNSPYANSFANVAKKTTTDVVDALVNKRHTLETDDFNGSYLSRSSLCSDFGTDMPAFGLGEELPYDVPELYPGEDDDGCPSVDVFGGAAAAPAPAAMAPAPAPSVNPFAAGRFDTETFDFGGSSLASLRQQQLMRTPRGSDASITSATDALLRSPRSSDASVFAEESFAPPVKVKREDARMSSSDAALKKSRTGKTTSSVAAAATATTAPKVVQQLAGRPSRVEIAAAEVDEDMEEENVYQAELASASARGDAALIRQIKNGREKTRRARMCTKFEELHAILNVSTEMMARYTGVGLPAADKVDANSASGSYEKKGKFKKAQVLNAAVKTIEGMQQTFLDMQSQIDALQRQNEALKQQRRYSQSI
jgi:hypothetical protein